MSEKMLSDSGVGLYRDWVHSLFPKLPYSLPTDAVPLWQNLSPTSSFSAQDVFVNLSFFKGIVIEYAPYTGVPSRLYTRPIPKYSGDPLLTIGVKEGYYGGRFCTVFNDHVNFTSGRNHSIDDNAAVAIPIAIYGTNYVRKWSYQIPEGGKSLLVRRDLARSSISFSASLQSNGNTVYDSGWKYSDMGTGYLVITRRQTNSYALLVSNETVRLVPGKSIHVKGIARGYPSAGNVFFGIPKNSRPDDLLTVTRSNTDWQNLSYMSGDAKVNLVSSANVLTPFHVIAGMIQGASNNGTQTMFFLNNYTGQVSQFSTSATFTNFYLALMVAGSGDSNYHGKLCIEEIYEEDI